MFLCYVLWNINIICIYRIGQFLSKLRSPLEPTEHIALEQSCCDWEGQVREGSWGARVHQTSKLAPWVVAPEVSLRKSEGSVVLAVKLWGLVFPPNCLLRNPTLRECSGFLITPPMRSNTSRSVLPFSPHVQPTSGRRAAVLRNSRENRDRSFLLSCPNPHTRAETHNLSRDGWDQSGPRHLGTISTESEELYLACEALDWKCCYLPKA